MNELKTKAEALNNEIKRTVDMLLRYNFSINDLASMGVEELEGIKQVMTCANSMMDFLVDEAEKVGELGQKINDLDKKLDKVLDKEEKILEGIHRLESRSNKAKES